MSEADGKKNIHAYGGDFWQTTARLEQPGQNRLPKPGSHQCQAAASLTTLASGEATGHL